MLTGPKKPGTPTWREKRSFRRRNVFPFSFRLITAVYAGPFTGRVEKRMFHGQTGSWFGWVGNIAIGVFSLFFFVFGIEVLVGAYDLKQPQHFIMYFFSGSFITLISLVGILHSAFRIRALLSRRQPVSKED